MNRGAITSAKRVVIKIGSSSLTGSAGSELDPHAVQKVVDLAYSLKKRGAEVVVVSSGAIAAGLSPLGLKVTEIYARTSRDFNAGVQSEIKRGDNIFAFPKLNITHGSRESQNPKTPKPHNLELQIFKLKISKIFKII